MALNLFLIFFQFGLFCFGGGNSMLVIFENELVAERGYLTAAQFADMIAVSQITPGPFAVNIATYTGAALGASIWQSILYSLCATVGITLPAIMYVMLIARFFKEFGSSAAVSGVMGGIRPAIIGLIISSMLLMCRLSLYDRELFAAGEVFASINYKAVFICICAALAAKIAKINPVIVLFLAGIAGIIIL